MTMQYAVSRRRRWPWIVVVAVIVFAGLWTAAWHYAAGTVEATIAGWREREAKVGRIYACATQTIGGFPFRIEVHCSEPSAEFRRAQPPTALKWKDLRIRAHVLTPTRLVADVASPMLIGSPGGAGELSANWKHGTVTVLGLPTAPERVTLALEDASVERLAGGGNESVWQAKSVALVGRMVDGSAMSNPVIEFTLKLSAATAPKIHSAAAMPVDAEITALLRGLRNFAPKTWAARFREIQAAGGRIEVTKARLQQGEVIAVTTGQVGLSPRGRLNGELQMTIANFEQLVPRLGLDRVTEQAAAPGSQLGTALSALDRMMPGLGNLARQNAGPAVIAGMGVIGKPTELEGRRATTVPLRFNDGMASLGPIPLGPTPPLY